MNRKIGKILKHYGIRHQKMKAVEELSELQTAVLKNVMKGGHEADILEEMADVYIMLHQLKAIYGFDDRSIDLYVEFKVNRELERIK